MYYQLVYKLYLCQVYYYGGIKGFRLFNMKVKKTWH